MSRRCSLQGSLGQLSLLRVAPGLHIQVFDFLLQFRVHPSRCRHLILQFLASLLRMHRRLNARQSGSPQLLQALLVQQSTCIVPVLTTHSYRS